MEKHTANKRFLYFVLCVMLLTGLAISAPLTTAQAQTGDRFDLAYETQGNIFLASFENGTLIANTPLTQDAGGNVNPSWSLDGRYLMYTHYEASNPNLRILDTLTYELMAVIPNACCGTWDPSSSRIAYIDTASNQLVSNYPDDTGEVVLWPLNGGLQPFGRGAWAPDGTLYFSFSQGDAATQVWAISPGGHAQMVLASSTFSDNPFASSVLSDPAISADGQLSVTLDSSALGYAPGGPLTLVGYGGVTSGGFGRWQAELFGGKSASWAPNGQRFAWEDWKGCNEIGIDAPGYCKAGIGIYDLNTGRDQLILPNPDYNSPAWRPAIPELTPVATEAPPVTTTQAPVATEAPSASVTAVPDFVGAPLPNDGHNPVDLSKSLLTRIHDLIIPPVEAAYTPDECRAKLAGKDNLYVGQCTWFVGYYRPDVCDWGGGNAYQWVGKALDNAKKYNLIVRDRPQPGDIAVWLPSTESDCGGASKIPATGPCTEIAPEVYQGCGHVAYVTSVSADGTTMRIKEGNWSPDRSDKVDVKILSCMKFISPPNTVEKTPAPLVPNIVQTPAAPSLLDSVKSWWCEHIGIGCSSSW
jgi:surface antigen